MCSRQTMLSILAVFAASVTAHGEEKIIAIAGSSAAETEYTGFVNHGVGAPVLRSSGVFAATDAAGRPLIVAWAGGTLRLIDARTGDVDSVPFPADGPSAGRPFYGLMTEEQRLYNLVSGYFLEFDVARRAFTFSKPVTDPTAMAITAADDGVIYASTNPGCRLIAFDPTSRELTDFGPMNEEEWQQHPRSLAASPDGWVYIGVGSVRSRVVAFQPGTRTRRTVFADEYRRPGAATVFRGEDGFVYARPYPDAALYRLDQGDAVPLHDDIEPPSPRAFNAGDQGYLGVAFPDGGRIVSFSMPERLAVIRDPESDTPRELRFDYEVDNGPLIFSLIRGPDGCIYAATGHPLRWIRYEPTTGVLRNWGRGRSVGHINAMTVMDGRIYAAYYAGGMLFEYDPRLTQSQGEHSGLKLLAHEPLHVFRPHVIVSYPSGHLVMAGTQGRSLAYGGGGMLIHHPGTGADTVLTYADLLPGHRTQGLAVLPDGNLLGGTITRPRPGYPPNDERPVLYVLDWETKRIVFRRPLPEPHGEILQLLSGPDGYVYGITRSGRGPGQSWGHSLFVFDPATRDVVHSDIGVAGPGLGMQGPRLMDVGPDGRIYILLAEAIYRLTPRTFELGLVSRSPVSITNGMAIAGDRLYFAAGSRLWSYDLSR